MNLAKKGLIIIWLIMMVWGCETKETTTQSSVKDTLPQIKEITQKNYFDIARDDSFSNFLKNVLHHNTLQIDTLTSELFSHKDSLFLEKYTQNRPIYAHPQLFKNRDFTIKTYHTDINDTTVYIEINQKKLTINQLVSQGGNVACSFDTVFKIQCGNKQYLVFRGGWSLCNGTFCMAGIHFLYDVSLQKLYVFSDYAMENNYLLFGDANKDGQLDFLEFNMHTKKNVYDTEDFEGHCQIYTQNSNGEFEIMKDSTNQPYEIKFKGQDGVMVKNKIEITSKKWMN